MKTRLFRACFLLASLGAIPVHANEQPSVGFDWFEYTGRDTIFNEDLAKGNYRNPVIAGFHPDPSIVRVGGDYYLVNSSFAYFPGLPIFHSRDLVNWKQIGHALSRRSQLRFENRQGMSRGIFAPTIRFHDGLFYIITTDVDGIGNFYITAADPAGPWSDPVRLPEINGIDPDIFFDADGRVYITHNGEPEGTALYDGHRAIWMWEFDLENRKVVAGSGKVIVNAGADPKTQPIWIEGPHLYKINDWYYLSCAEGGTGDQHSQVVFRTRNLADPFMPFEQNPILTQRDLDPSRQNPVTSTGHADFVQTSGGEWWAVFLGVRPYERDFYNTGRETFMLPVHWQDEWPVILEAQTPVPWQVKRPGLPADQARVPPQTGNFTWRDDFERLALKPDWIRLRTSETRWANVDPETGFLRLTALSASLKDKTQPAYLARVQQHRRFAASTRMELPAAENIAAGLAAFQNSAFHYFLGVKKTPRAYTVFLEEVRDGVSSVAAETELSSQQGYIVLGMEQKDATILFHYSVEPGENVVLASNVDAKLLSTRTAGGFVGATIGMHARSE